jgi:hypothetical protein
MKYLFAVIVILGAVTVGQAQIILDCPGPDGTAWSDSHQACDGNPNTSCDSINKSTCYYGLLMSGGYLGGKFNKKTGVFIVGNPGGIPDVQVGDQVRALGAASAKRLTNLRTPGLLTRYQKGRPARSLRLRLYRPKTGSWLTVTWRP